MWWLNHSDPLLLLLWPWLPHIWVLESSPDGCHFQQQKISVKLRVEVGRQRQYGRSPDFVFVTKYQVDALDNRVWQCRMKCSKLPTLLAHSWACYIVLSKVSSLFLVVISFPPPGEAQKMKQCEQTRDAAPPGAAVWSTQLTRQYTEPSL